MTRTYDVEPQTLLPQPSAVVRADLYAEQIPQWLPGVYEEILDHLTAVRLPPVGPPFARYRFHRDRVEVEAGFPVMSEAPRHGRVAPSTLPGGRVAVVIHHGPYETLGAAYDAVTHWLTEHRYYADGPHWEVYHTDPRVEPDPTHWRTEVVAPFR